MTRSTVTSCPHEWHFRDFDLAGGVYIVTGGARGLGLSMAEALVEAGGKVYCLDRLPNPDESFHEAQQRVRGHSPTGSLHYGQLDVRDTPSLDSTISSIAAQHHRLDGIVAAAGIQQLCPAVDYSPEDARRMIDINFNGVMMTATAAGRAMLQHKSRGSIVLIASMSGMIANKGLISPVYNASKAAVIQLARNLAMEWGRKREDGSGGIRVNALSPGHIMTPMVKKNFEEVEGLKDTWEKENMLGRLSAPEEFRGAGVFLLSRASSFMTGNNLVIDGGHTAW
ncbi:3-alpha--hydroxysteroid dehydrogenase [Rhizodiscina lignyota]|uniref:3-alpha--hydroxysteroid dehydrogenase n=1 Tax=Rhizodiscina lignyota TaxID=1504668 RepID=A0A9P4I9Q8_9PEZI|nr:3-alpha--hydroxysteroid dehydrogenase [Rhizodiscina lignyota]